jgi:hypothetical protein
VLALLGLVWVFNVLGVVVLVVSLVSHSGGSLTGRQLLFSGSAALLTDAIAFGLAFWELDCGGPVLYVSLTNAIAFSPTDTLPLTRPAKALMAAESTLSGITLLLVAARAVNILR